MAMIMSWSNMKVNSINNLFGSNFTTWMVLSPQSFTAYIIACGRCWLTTQAIVYVYHFLFTRMHTGSVCAYPFQFNTQWGQKEVRMNKTTTRIASFIYHVFVLHIPIPLLIRIPIAIHFQLLLILAIRFRSKQKQCVANIKTLCPDQR